MRVPAPLLLQEWERAVPWDTPFLPPPPGAQAACKGVSRPDIQLWVPESTESLSEAPHAILRGPETMGVWGWGCCLPAKRNLRQSLK